MHEDTYVSRVTTYAIEVAWRAAKVAHDSTGAFVDHGEQRRASKDGGGAAPRSTAILWREIGGYT